MTEAGAITAAAAQRRDARSQGIRIMSIRGVEREDRRETARRQAYEIRVCRIIPAEAIRLRLAPEARMANSRTLLHRMVAEVAARRVRAEHPTAEEHLAVAVMKRAPRTNRNCGLFQVNFAVGPQGSAAFVFR
jgi:hypothetical protein